LSALFVNGPAGAAATPFELFQTIGNARKGRQAIASSAHNGVPVTAGISSLIAAADGGDRPAAEALFSALYSELHRIARRELRRHAYGDLLGATSLLHEAYLDLSRREAATFPDRHRFMAYAARVMRGLVIDYVRNRQAQKRGGKFELTTISTDVADATAQASELERVSTALDALAEVDPLLADVVDLKFFCGFSFAEIAAMKGVSERTVQRLWHKARLYLHRAVREAMSTR
jgi:RNA polymerase sigma factor (TIGR02999 family)